MTTEDELKNLAVVEVLKQSADAEVTTTILHLIAGSFPDELFGPAWLLPTEDAYGAVGATAPQLHRLITIDKAARELTYETYEISAPLLAPRSRRYVLRAWWLPQGVAAVTDTTLRWDRTTYDVEGDHEHCLLTWETIGPGDVAYESGEG